ncbi:enoyl-CoA hydratase/isomerase family protein [Candidatus Neomarinimicrobiota bacterium]
MSLIDSRIQQKVLIAEFQRGVTNPIDLEFIDELQGILQAARSNPDIHALVLTSANDKFFSIGLDIPHLYDLSPVDFSHFYHEFNRVCIEMYSLPIPIVAAITGHAVAGGCILAICCDHRFIAEGHKLMGLNEIKLGVPVPYPAHCILHQLVGDANARELMYLGEFIEPEDALKASLVDQVLPLHDVRPKAIEFAATLGGLSRSAFRVMKQNHTQPVVTRIHEQLEEKESIFVEHWYGKDTRKILKAAITKF